MKKAITFILLAFTFVTGAVAQVIGGLNVGAGVATYNPTSLIEVQEVLLEGFPVEGQITNLFPAYTVFSICYFRPVTEKLNLGVIYQNGSTGARATYEDYSGSIFADQILTMYQFGLNTSYRLMYANYFELRAYTSLMMSFTGDEITRETYIPGYYLREYLKINARNPVFEPGLELIYHHDPYSFGIDFGYQYDFGAKFNVKGDQNTYFYHPVNTSEIVKTEISGIRARLKFIIWIRDTELSEY